MKTSSPRDTFVHHDKIHLVRERQAGGRGRGGQDPMHHNPGPGSQKLRERGMSGRLVGDGPEHEDLVVRKRGGGPAAPIPYLPQDQADAEGGACQLVDDADVAVLQAAPHRACGLVPAAAEDRPLVVDAELQVGGHTQRRLPRASAPQPEVPPGTGGPWAVQARR